MSESSAILDLHLYVKCHSSASVFRHFASVNQLTGFSMSGKLAAYANTYTYFLINYRLLNTIYRKDIYRKRI